MLFGRKGSSTMDVMGAIEKRRSVREYKPDDIPEDVLDKLYIDHILPALQQLYSQFWIALA